MSKLNNIAKQLTLLAIMLVAGSCYAFAQDENLAATPYIDSKQMYQVPMGNIVNSRVEWELDDGTTTHDIGNVAWADTSRNTSTGFAIAVITFQNATFAPNQSWTLIYYEYDNVSGGCSAVRSFNITTKANTFNLSLPLVETPDCNTLSGTVIPNDIDLSDDITIRVPFEVHINKSEDFRVTQWSFIGTVGVSAGYAVNNPLIGLGDSTGTTTRGYAWEVSDVGATNFTLTVTVTDPAENYTADTLTFYAEILGPPITEVDVTLTLSNGVAQSGSGYTKLTNDNTGLGIDRIFVAKYLGIPNTSVIAVND